MKKYTILFLLAFLTGPAFGQIMKGFVYDKETNEPLAGVNITYKRITGETNGTISEADGSYQINLPEGGVDLLFTYIGYENEQVPVVINRNETKTRNIFMQVKANLLGDVVVSAGRFEQKLSNVTVSMDLLKAEDITKQAPTDLSATLNTMPGVDINDKQPSIRGGNGWTYGVGSRSLVLIDGMSALTSGTGIINWNIVPLENIEQVEVMKGASSVLYGSSALNGVINIRTKRPSLTPVTTLRAYLGIYGDPDNEEYRWSDKSFWKEGKYEVEPFLRKNVFSGIRNPIYEGIDFSHARRIGNFDVSAGLNMFTDEGYKKQGYNKRFRAGGNLTYHQPMKDGNLLNYGFNVNFMSDKYADFFLWRSPKDVYEPSPIANMGREANTFYIDPFFNFTNPNNNTSHKVKARFYYRGDNIADGSNSGKSITDILGNMGTDVNAITGIVQNVQNGDYSMLYPIIQPALQGDLNGLVNGTTNLLGSIFPTATTADYCDLLSWVMKRGIPSSTSDLIPWLSNAINPKADPVTIDKNYTYYLDYQFNKKWDNGTQITAGATYEHMRSTSVTTGNHDSDNAALFFQYDQRFFDRLSVSAGMRAEYYRVDDFLREADTKIFGAKVPVKPIFRAGLNYQLADYSFIRASFGQGYRNPSINEKYLRKDIGGVGIYPNLDIKPEKGYNAELGFKQGYKIGNFQGFVDVAGFYTEYRDMVEFQFGLFNNADYSMINSISDAIQMVTDGKGFGIGAQFHNVSKAQIYGMEISTNGVYDFNKNTKLFYNLGYVYTEPRDADYKERNEIEDLYTDALQMKEKSNTGKYLKYRPKHSFKATVDFQWKRINLGANFAWKSKILAVDYLMMDEREKQQQDLMDYVRTILFGKSRGETLATYWKKHNTDYATVDLRFGVKATKEVAFQFMVNNLLNKEYSYRPMAVAAPRTFVVKMDITF